MQRFQLLFKPRSACSSVVEHGILYKRGPGLSDFAFVLTAYELEIFTRTVQYSNYPVQVTSQYSLRASDGKFLGQCYIQITRPCQAYVLVSFSHPDV